MSKYRPISTHQEFGALFNPTGGLELNLVGDWKKLPALFQYLGGGSFNRGIKRDIAKAVRDFLTRYKANLIKGITSEGAAIGQMWPAHGRYYKRKYKKHPIGLLNYVYLRALHNLQLTQSSYIVSLKFSKGDLSRRSVKGGITLGQYSVIFEKGREGRFYQPPRPLWQGALEHMGGPNKLLRNIHGAVDKRLKELT